MFKKILSVCICLTLVFSVVGCSGPAPVDSVKNFFDALSKQDMETANSYLVSQDQELGKDEILRLIYAGLEYEIISSKTNNDKAVVTAKVSVPDLDIIMGNMYTDVFAELLELGLSDPTAVEVKSAQLAEEYIKKALSDPNAPMVTSEINVRLMKINNTKNWHIVGNSELTSALSGSFSTAMSNLNAGLYGPTSAESDTVSSAFTPIGREVQFPDRAVTITKVEKSSGVDNASPKPGCEFLIATIHIKNMSPNETIYTPVFPVLETSSGDFFNMSSSVESNTDDNPCFARLEPGEECDGNVIFEQNVNDPGVYIHFTNMGGDTVFASFGLPQ